MMVRQPVPIGTKVKMHPGGEHGAELREYTITEVYDHFAVAVDAIGIRQCISNVDLVHMGLAIE